MPAQRALAHAPRISAHVLFINDSGQVLLRLRDDRAAPPDPGEWDLVGGAVEAGETITEAARRAVNEEIGLDVLGLDYFGEYPEQVLDDVFVNNVFLAKLSLPLEALALTEGQRLRYVGAAEARALNLAAWVARSLDDYFFVAR